MRCADSLNEHNKGGSSEKKKNEEVGKYMHSHSNDYLIAILLFTLWKVMVRSGKPDHGV